MFRSPRLLQAPAHLAVSAAVMAVIMVAGLAPAWADTTRPGPVKDLKTSSVDLHTGVSTLDGTVTVEGTRGGAKARIDATVLFGKDSAVLRPGAPGTDPAGREGVRPERPGEGPCRRLHR